MLLVGLMTATAARGDILVAARTIPARSILEAADLTLAPGGAEGPDAGAVLGREAKVTIYAGQPIRPENFTAPALVERNQIVALVFRRGRLEIRAEGRALGRGGAGESVRVLNTASRSTVTGLVGADGSVWVSPQD